MKNTLLKSLLALWCAGGLLLAPGCKKVDDVFSPRMPDATQEGKNTFGCLVNGALWLPYNPDAPSIFPSDYTLRVNRFPIQASTLTIDIKNLKDTNSGVTDMTLSIRATTAIGPGVYNASNGFSASAREGVVGYSTATAGTGSITITKVEPFTRTVNGITSNKSIVSGTFEFTAGGSNGKTLTVTQGRFDQSPEQ